MPSERVTTTPNGGGMTGKNAAGQCTELYTFGGRSFSIWDTDIKRVYDSGDEFERRTSTLPNARALASRARYSRKPTMDSIAGTRFLPLCSHAAIATWRQ